MRGRRSSVGRWAVAALILAVVVAVFWALMSRGPTPPTGEGTSPQGDRSASAAPPETAAPSPRAADARGSTGRSESQGEIEAPDTAPSPPPASRLDTGDARTIAGYEIIVVKDGTPVPEAKVEVWHSPPFPEIDGELAITRGEPWIPKTPSQLDFLLRARARIGEPFVDVARLGDVTWDPPDQVLTSDDGGRCRIDAPVPLVTIVATKEDVGASGRTPVSASFRPIGLQPVHLCGLQTIRARVVTSGESPGAGLRVRFLADSLPTPIRPSSQRPRLPRPVVTDREGRFSVDIHSCANWSQTLVELIVDGPGRPTLFPVRASEEEIVLRLGDDYRIDGTVRWPPGDELLGTLWSVAPDGEEREVRVDREGLFLHLVDGPGEYVLQARDSQLIQSQDCRVVLTPEERTRSVTIELVAPTFLAGQVVWEDGSPIANTAVLLLRDFLPVFAEDRRGGAWTRRTTGDGRFHLGFLRPDETYQLRIGGDGRLPWPVDVWEIPSGAGDLLVTVPRHRGLDAAGTLVVRVTDGGDGVVSGARVQLEGAAPRPSGFGGDAASWPSVPSHPGAQVQWARRLRCDTDAGGAARVPSFPPGRYRVSARLGDRGPVETVVTLEAGAEARVDLVLPEAGG